MSLPFNFHGRDFSTKNNMYLQRLLEFHEAQRVYSRYRTLFDSKGNDSVSNRHCRCHGYLKCYHFIVHDPVLLTAEFATKFHLLKANGAKDLMISSTPIHAGNSSTLNCISLRHKDLKEPLLSKIVLACHVDPIKRKSVKICDLARNRVETYLSQQTKEKLNEIKDLHNEFKDNMDAMNKLLNGSNECLYQCAMQIQHTDIDMNIHVNQAVYGKFIENALFEYCEDYHNGKYVIKAITLNYLMDIRIVRGQGFPFCVVKILNDIDKSGKSREIAGVVEYNGMLRCQFKLMLMADDGDRLKRINSKL